MKKLVVKNMLNNEIVYRGSFSLSPADQLRLAKEDMRDYAEQFPDYFTPLAYWETREVIDIEF